MAKIRLNEADDNNPTPSIFDGFSDGVKQALDSNDWDKAFKNANPEELDNLMALWLDEFLYVSVDAKGKTIDQFVNELNNKVNDLNKVIQLTLEWYTAFGSVNEETNPFFNYLSNIRSYDIIPTYDDLLIINNKYADNTLENNNLRLSRDDAFYTVIFSTKGWYGGDNVSKEYWLDVYAYLSDKSACTSLLKKWNNENPKRKVPINNEKGLPDTKNLITKWYDFRDLVLSVEGRYEQMRSKDEIDTIINSMDKPTTYSYDGEDTQSTKKRNKIKDIKKLDKFLNDTNLLSDENRLLASDLKSWLNNQSDI